MAFTFSSLWTVVAAVILVAAAAGALFVWWKSRKSRQASAAEEGNKEKAAGADILAVIDQSFRDAKRQLRKSLSNIPIFLVVGPKGAGKTSILHNCGLDAELLAGQVSQGASIIPTQALNIWLVRQAVFVEIAPSLASDKQAFQRVLKHISPRRIALTLSSKQAPRAILLCVPQEAIVSADPEPDGLSLNRVLTSISGALGLQLPVYVLITKMDQVLGFGEFVANLSSSEARQALGATIRPFSRLNRGAYAEQTTHLLEQYFSELTYSLSDHRVLVLPREQEKTRLAVAYEFPRAFDKFENKLISFLVEISKPSQLRVSPFLRGFYFCGTRQVAAEQARSAPVSSPSQLSTVGGATLVMSAEQMKSQMAQLQAFIPEVSTKSEWVFLQSLFSQVLLSDHRAHGASALSTRTDRLRAAAMVFAGCVGLVLLAAFTGSFIGNRLLEKELSRSAKAIKQNPSATTLAQIEQLRKPVQLLAKYSFKTNKTPNSIRWGLYRGAELLGPAQSIYCSAIRSAVIDRTAQTMAFELGRMRTGNDDPTAEFRLLKAYMMITTHPDKADEAFLSNELVARASASAGNREEATRLLSALSTYAVLLGVPDELGACVVRAAIGVIPDAQAYLHHRLNLNDRYESLLGQAGRGVNEISYNDLFPNDAVRDDFIIRGCFTREGWENMQGLLQHPERSLKTDAWVLGEAKDLSQQELEDLVKQYRSKYNSDYIDTWKRFLQSAKIATYGSLADAAAKLDKMGGQRSVLLSLIALTAEQTGVSDDHVKEVFKPAKAVTPAMRDFRPATDYLRQIDQLQVKSHKAAQSTGPPHEQDVLQLRDAASAARSVVDEVARLPGFQGDTDAILKDILLRPIKGIEDLGRGEPIRALNAAGKNLCTVYEQLNQKLPFFDAQEAEEATINEVSRVLGQEGQFEQFYKIHLRESLNCVGAICSEPASPTFHLTRPFIAFINYLYQWSRILYGEGQESTVHLKLRALAYNSVKQVDLSMGDVKISLNVGRSEFTQLNWKPGQTLGVDVFFEGEPASHTFVFREPNWALFKWLADAENATRGSDYFQWVPRSGRSPAQRENGKNMDYRIQVRWENVFLDHGLFESKKCTSLAAN